LGINVRKKKVVFLDRDGTVNIDREGYIKKPDEFELFDFSSEAIRILNKMGFLVIIVTNQSGIAREYYSIKDLEAIHAKMICELELDNAHLDEIYYSPYHREGTLAPYAISHEDRKPGLGMFNKALEKYHFQVNESLMIGDKYTDVEFGRKAGLKTILVLTGSGKKEFLEDRNRWKYRPNYVADNLLTAVKLIEKIGRDQ